MSKKVDVVYWTHQDLDGLSFSDLEAIMADVRDQCPAEVRGTLRLRVSEEEGGYGMSSIRIDRDLTSAERAEKEAERLAFEQSEREKREENDRREFERLKAKFGPAAP